MSKTEKLYLCERCKKKVDSRGMIVLFCNTIDNSEKDYECDICGALSSVLDLCEVVGF